MAEQTNKQTNKQTAASVMMRQRQACIAYASWDADARRDGPCVKRKDTKASGFPIGFFLAVSLQAWPGSEVD